MSTVFSRFLDIFKALWLLFLLLWFVESYEWRKDAAKVSALYVFGDSTVDPGNNNYLLTIFKANFPPYGRDFTAHKSTGRFSNGKLATDFIAAGLGLKETLPAYLDPTLTTQDFITGVSFASAGTGYDNLTAETATALPLWKQLDYFKDYRQRLRMVVGEEKASDIIENALFFSSMGTNDLAFFLNIPTVRKQQFSLEQYGDFLQQEAANFIQKLAKAGAHRLLMIGVPGIGCLPVIKTLQKTSKCLEGQNQAANDFNEKIRQMLARVQPLVPQLKMLYGDLYSISMDFFQNPHKYEFENSERGCCGTGLIEAGPLCNAKSADTCSDASKYVFWDAIHPSERANAIVAKLFLKRDIPSLL